MWKLNNQWVKPEETRETRKKSLREMKRKQNAPKVWDKMKALLRDIQSQVLTLKKKKKTQVKNPAFYLQKLEKKRKSYPKQKEERK